MVSKVLFSRESDEWETPKDLFNELDKEFHFNLDLCANSINHLCEEYSSIEKPYLFPVNKNIYCNPPYSRLADFIAYCSALSLCNNVVMLIPARTDTKAFHTYIYKKSNVEIRFLKGRIKFCKNGVPMNSAPFPSMIVIFKRFDLLGGVLNG